MGAWHEGLEVVAQFLAMGGYALYVWGSFGMCAVLMVMEPWMLARRRTLVLHRLALAHACEPRLASTCAQRDERS
jgi:heme exporter protein D